MQTRYKLTMCTDDMGTFEQPGCRNWEDALWHVNSARNHDNLPPMDLDELKRLSRAGKGSFNYAKMTPES